MPDQPQRLSYRWAVLWTLATFALLPFGRAIVEPLRHNGLLAYSIMLVLVLAGVASAGFIRLARQRGLSSAAALLALVSIGTTLVGVWFLVGRIEERWHIVQYGVLGALVLAPQIVGRSQTTALGVPLVRSALAVGAVGWLDEGIQYLLPSRVYDLNDVVLNAIAGTLGCLILAGVMLVQQRQSRVQ